MRNAIIFKVDLDGGDKPLSATKLVATFTLTAAPVFILMGAIISVDTDRVITVIGVKEMHGFTHTAITDRIEAASWACARSEEAHV